MRFKGRRQNAGQHQDCDAEDHENEHRRAKPPRILTFWVDCQPDALPLGASARVGGIVGGGCGSWQSNLDARAGFGLLEPVFKGFGLQGNLRIGCEGGVSLFVP